MKEKILKRSKEVSLEIYKICKKLDKGLDRNVLGHQLLRSATSFASNYRAACRSRSKREFVAKLSICIEESDETLFWLEFLIEAGVIEKDRVRHLIEEVDELLSIFVASKRTVQKGMQS